jgi:hypothetical protein
MHESVLQFVSGCLYRNEVEGKSVLEVGSYNVNGSVRGLVMAYNPASYLGIDICEGPGVDEVHDVAQGLGGGYDLVISTEMLEHAEHWQKSLASMVEATKETLILTARGPGFPRHNPPDFWRFRPHDLTRAVEGLGLRVVLCGGDPQVPGVFLKAVRPGFIEVPQAPKE